MAPLFTLAIVAIALIWAPRARAAACGEPPLSGTGVDAPPRRVGGYLLDVGRPFTTDACLGRACLCTLDEDVYMVRGSAAFRVRQTSAGSVEYVEVAYSTGAQAVVCGADGMTLLVATPDAVLLYAVDTDARDAGAEMPLTLVASSATVTMSADAFGLYGVTWNALVAVDTGARKTLAVGLLTRGGVGRLAAVTFTANVSYAVDGASWPGGHTGGLMVRTLTPPEALRARTLSAAGLRSRGTGALANVVPAVAPLPTVVVYAQSAATALDESIPTTNDDMIVTYWHADVDAPDAAGANPASVIGGLASDSTGTVELYGAYTPAGRPRANLYAFRRTDRWPHYRNDTALEATVRSDGIRRVVFAPDTGIFGAQAVTLTGAAWLRAYVVSVPLSGASMRTNFRDTAPNVWQCVLAFEGGDYSDAAVWVPGRHPALECQTRAPFMPAATEQTRATWNLLEAFHPRPIVARAPLGAAPVDVFATAFRLGAPRENAAECGVSLGLADVMHQTLAISGASATPLPWRPAADGDDFWAEARAAYPDREGWNDTAGVWDRNATLLRHSYDAGVGALEPDFTRRAICQADLAGEAPDDDANAPLAQLYGLARHMDSTPSGLVWIGTAYGLLRYQLVPAAAAAVRLEAPTRGSGALARGAMVNLTDPSARGTGAWLATVRFAGAAPVAARMQAVVVRTSDVRPDNRSYSVAIEGVTDACRGATYAVVVDLRAVRDWLVDGLYTLRLLETYAVVAGSDAAAWATHDAGMAFLAVRAAAPVMPTRAALEYAALGAWDAASEDYAVPVRWWELPGGADAIAAGASTALLPASVRVTPDGQALYAVTRTHLVRLPRPFFPAGLGAARAAAANLTWAAVAWPLPVWCRNGTWDSVALDATEPAYMLACTYDVPAAATTWTAAAPAGWPHGDTNAALYVWTTPAANASVFDGWRSLALMQAPAPVDADGTPRVGRVGLLAVDGGFAEVMHWYGADPFTFGVTHYAPWPAPLRALATGGSVTDAYAVRAQDQWGFGARGSAAARNVSVATAAAAAAAAALYSVPANAYVANSNLLQASRTEAQAPYDWPYARIPRAYPEVSWTTAAPDSTGRDPDGKRVAVFFAPGGAVVCGYEDASAPVGVSARLGLYTNGPCRRTPMAPVAVVTDAQVVTGGGVSVLLTTTDDGAHVRLATLFVDRDLRVYTLSAVEFTTAYAGARRALAFVSLGLVTFADREFAFDSASGRILGALGTRTLAASSEAVPPVGAAWMALSMSERRLVWVNATDGALAVRVTRVANATTSAWAPPGSTARTFLGCNLGADDSACSAAALAAGIGTPRRTTIAQVGGPPSARATDVYPTDAREAPDFVRPWAGAADWYGAYPPNGPASAAVVGDATAPWFHAETRYRTCARAVAGATTAAERPRRYAGTPDVWTCYNEGTEAAHPRIDRTVASCGGGYTASVSVDWAPRDGRWDTMETHCHLTVHAPCTNATANIHCVVTNGIEASVGWFAPADVFPVNFRFPALEALGVAPATRLRMCRGPELLHACLMDERACLAVDDADADGTGDVREGFVVAVSCDATLWERYSPEETAVWGAAQWRAQIAAGALTWHTPVNLRLSYGAGAGPVHEGALRDDLDTIAIAADAALGAFEPRTRACTPEEAALCPGTGSVALACTAVDQRSRASGRHVFSWVVPGSVVCPPLPLAGLADLQRAALTDAQARALCGACWAPTDAVTGAPVQAPVVLAWDAATRAPIAVAETTCACPACAPAWNDSRACAVPNAAARCSAQPNSYFGAVRLCGPSALGCAYRCSSATSAAPVCAAEPGTCVCAYRSSDPHAPMPCIAPPGNCSAAEQVAQCGPWAATCARHADNALVTYECTGVPGAVRDAATRRFLTPPYAAVASFRAITGAGSGAALRAQLVPDADRDAALRGGVPHWDCGWTAAYLRANRTKAPGNGARLGYAGYEALGGGAAPPPLAPCVDVDGTLGTGLLLLTDAAGTMRLWDGVTGTNRSGVGIASLGTRAVLPPAPRVSEAARYVALTNSPCDGVADGAPPVCRGGRAGVTQTLVGGSGRASVQVADPDGLLRLTVWDTAPGTVYTLSWAWALAVVRATAPANASFGADAAPSVVRVRVSDADTGGALVYSDQVVALPATSRCDWRVANVGADSGAPAAFVARGHRVWVDFMRVRGTAADVAECTAGLAAATGSAADTWATQWCAAAADTDAGVAARCLGDATVAGSTLAARAAACGLEAAVPADGSRPHVRRAEGTRLLLLDDFQVVRHGATGGASADGGYAPWATWRVQGARMRLDFATALRDSTGVSARGGGVLETSAPDHVPGAFVAADLERPNSAVRPADGALLTGSNATVLRMSAADAGRAWLALPDTAPLGREYTKSVWVRFGAGGDGGYDDADARAWTALLSDAYGAPFGLAPLNGFGIARGEWLYCGSHRTAAADLSDAELADPSTATAARRGWAPYSSAPVVPVGAQMRVNATWLYAWHHLACRARAVDPARGTSVPPFLSPPRRLIEYTLFVDGVPQGARGTDSTGPVLAVTPETAADAWQDPVTGAPLTAPPAATHRVGGVPWGSVRPQAPSHVDNPTVYARALTDTEIAALYTYDGDSAGDGVATPLAVRCADGTFAGVGACGTGDTDAIDAIAPAWSTAAFPIQLVMPVALDGAAATAWGPLPPPTASGVLGHAYGAAISSAALADALVSAAGPASGTSMTRARAAAEAAAVAALPGGAAGAFVSACLANQAGLDIADLATASTTRTTAMRAECRWAAAPLADTDAHPGPVSLGVYSSAAAAQAACVVDRRCVAVTGLPDNTTFLLRGTADPAEGLVALRAPAPGYRTWLLGCSRPSHVACGVWVRAGGAGASSATAYLSLAARRQILPGAPQPVLEVTNGQCAQVRAPPYTSVQAYGAADAVRLRTGSASYSRTAWVRLTVQCESAAPDARLIIYPDCVEPGVASTQTLNATITSGGAVPIDTALVPRACTDCDPALPRWVVRAPVYTGCDTYTGCVPEVDPDADVPGTPLFYSYLVSARCGARTWSPAAAAAADSPVLTGDEARAVCGTHATALPLVGCVTTEASGLTVVCDPATRNASDPAVLRRCVCPYVDTAAAEQGLPPCTGDNSTLRACRATERDALECDRTDAATTCMVQCTPAGCVLADESLCYNGTLTRAPCTAAEAGALCGREFARGVDACTVLARRTGPSGSRFVEPGSEVCACVGASTDALAFWAARMTAGDTATATGATAWLPPAVCACKGATQTNRTALVDPDGSGNFTNVTVSTWTCPGGVVLPCTAAETAATCTAENVQRAQATAQALWTVYDTDGVTPYAALSSTANATVALAGAADGVDSARLVQRADTCQRTTGPAAAVVDVATSCPGANRTLRQCTAAEVRRECGSDASASACVMACVPWEPLSFVEAAGCSVVRVGPSYPSTEYPGYNATDVPLWVDANGAVASGPRSVATFEDAIRRCVTTSRGQCNYVTAFETETPWGSAGAAAFSLKGASATGTSAAFGTVFNVTCSVNASAAALAAALAGRGPARCVRWGDCTVSRACSPAEAHALCGLVAPAGSGPPVTAADGAAPSASLARIGYYTSTRDAPISVSVEETGGAVWTAHAGDHAVGCTAFEEQTAVGVRVRATNCTWECPEGFYGEACSRAVSVNATCTAAQTAVVCGPPGTTAACTTDAYSAFRCVCADGWGLGPIDRRLCSGRVRPCSAARLDAVRWSGAYTQSCAVSCQGGLYYEAPNPAWVNDSTGALLPAGATEGGLSSAADTSTPVTLPGPPALRWAHPFAPGATMSWALETEANGGALRRWSAGVWTTAPLNANDSLLAAVSPTAALADGGASGRAGGVLDLSADVTHTVWCTATAPRNTESPPAGTTTDNFTVSVWVFMREAPTPGGAVRTILASAYTSVNATPPVALLYDPSGASASDAVVRASFVASHSDASATAGPACAASVCAPVGVWTHLALTFGVYRALDTRYVGAWTLWPRVAPALTCPFVDCVEARWSSMAQALQNPAGAAWRAPLQASTALCLCPRLGSGAALVLRAPGTAAQNVAADAAAPDALKRRVARADADGLLLGAGTSTTDAIAARAVPTAESRDSLVAACPDAYAAATRDTSPLNCAAVAAVDDAALACVVAALRLAAGPGGTGGTGVPVPFSSMTASCGLVRVDGTTFARDPAYDFGAPLSIPNPDLASDETGATPGECAVFGGAQRGTPARVPTCEYELGPLVGVARGARFSTFHLTAANAVAGTCAGASSRTYALLLLPSADACTTVGGTVSLDPTSGAAGATGTQVLCRLVQCGWVRDDDLSPGETRVNTTVATASLYANGVRAARTQWAATTAVSTLPTGPVSPVCIGSRVPTLAWGSPGRGTPTPLPALLDDLRGYSVSLTSPQVRALTALERAGSAVETYARVAANAAGEQCVVDAYVCQPNGLEEVGSGRPCGANTQRVRIETAAATPGAVTASAASVRVTAYTPSMASRASRAPARAIHGIPERLRILPQVVISVNASDAAARAALETRCGAHAVAAELDVPRSGTTGALQFANASPNGATCWCADGWYTELARFGYSATDPAGTGPCTQTVRGRACTEAEAALVPWNALRRSCPASAPFRCWVLCSGVPGSTGETCAQFAPQPCLDVQLENATCTPYAAAQACPVPANIAAQHIAFDWTCRGSCTFASAFGALPLGMAQMQTCASVYECAGSAKAAAMQAWAPVDAYRYSSAVPQTSALVQYTPVPCAMIAGRQPWEFCGAGAVDCVARCEANDVRWAQGAWNDTLQTYNSVLVGVNRADSCFAADQCTCATMTTDPISNATVRANVYVQSTPCESAGVTTADALARCGPFVANADAYACTAPGVGCSYRCTCLPGTGARVRSVNDPVEPLPCSAYLKPCDGPADATTRCVALLGSGVSTPAAANTTAQGYSACTLACVPAPVACASPPCWATECTVVRGSCVADTTAPPMVTLIGAGGVAYQVRSDTPGLRDHADPACQCATDQLMYPGRTGFTDDGFCSDLQECRETAPSPASTTGQCGVRDGYEHTPGCCAPTREPPALGTDYAVNPWGTLPVAPTARAGTPFECATMCPTPAQSCTVVTPSHAIGCPPRWRVLAGSCYTNPDPDTGVCQRASDLVDGAVYVDGGEAPQCSCASGCPGCALRLANGTMLPIDASHPAARTLACPVLVRAFATADACSTYCPAGTRVCTVNFTWIGNRTAICGDPATGTLPQASQTVLGDPCRYALRWGDPADPTTSAPLPVPVSCGTRWFDASLDPAAASATAAAAVGGSGVVLSNKVACTPAEAQRFCGRSAKACQIFNGVVRLEDCVCRDGATVVQPGANVSVLDAPFYGEYCVGDSQSIDDARECTVAETRDWCGLTGTAQCRARRVLVTADYAKSVALQLTSARLPRQRCTDWHVPMKNVPMLWYARRLMRVLLGASNTSAPELSAYLDTAALTEAEWLDRDFNAGAPSGGAGDAFYAAVGEELLANPNFTRCASMKPTLYVATTLPLSQRPMENKCDVAMEYTANRTYPSFGASVRRAACLLRTARVPNSTNFDPTVNDFAWGADVIASKTLSVSIAASAVVARRGRTADTLIQTGDVDYAEYSACLASEGCGGLYEQWSIDTQTQRATSVFVQRLGLPLTAQTLAYGKVGSLVCADIVDYTSGRPFCECDYNSDYSFGNCYSEKCYVGWYYKVDKIVAVLPVDQIKRLDAYAVLDLCETCRSLNTVSDYKTDSIPADKVDLCRYINIICGGCDSGLYYRRNGTKSVDRSTAIMPLLLTHATNVARSLQLTGPVIHSIAGLGVGAADLFSSESTAGAWCWPRADCCGFDYTLPTSTTSTQTSTFYFYGPPCVIGRGPDPLRRTYVRRCYTQARSGKSLVAPESPADWDAYHAERAAAAGTAEERRAYTHAFEWWNPGGLATWLDSVVRNGLTRSLFQLTSEITDGARWLLTNDTVGRSRPDVVRLLASYAERFNTSRAWRFEPLRDPTSGDPPAGDDRPTPAHECLSWTTVTDSEVFASAVPAAQRTSLARSYLGDLFSGPGWTRNAGVGLSADATAPLTQLWLPECTCYSNNSDMRYQRGAGAAANVEPAARGYGWRDLSAYPTTLALIGHTRCDTQVVDRVVWGSGAPANSCPIAANGRACAGVGTCNPSLSTQQFACRDQLFGPMRTTYARGLVPVDTLEDVASAFVRICGLAAQPAQLAPLAPITYFSGAFGGDLVSAANMLARMRFADATGPWSAFNGVAVSHPCVRVPRAFDYGATATSAWYASDFCAREAATTFAGAAIPAPFRRPVCLGATPTLINSIPILTTNPATKTDGYSLYPMLTLDLHNQFTALHLMRCADPSVPEINYTAPLGAQCTRRRYDANGFTAGTGFERGCPIGRTGNACAIMTETWRGTGADSWNDPNNTFNRMRWWGIAHLGTPCQSRAWTDPERPLLAGAIDLAAGTDCTAHDYTDGPPDTSGRTGCVNGVYDWDNGACACDAGWARPVDLYRARVPGWPVGESIANSGWESRLYAAWDAHAATVKSVASAFWMCVVPGYNVSARAVGGSPCVASGTVPDAATCLGVGVCPVCNGRGTCVAGAGCVCNTGWYGLRCEYAADDLCSTSADLSGVARLPAVDPATGLPLAARGCSGHGVCALTNINCTGCGAIGIRAPECCTLEGHCECVAGRGYGWAGRNCSTPYVDVVSGTLNGTAAGVVGTGSAGALTNQCLNGGTLRADAPPPPGTPRMAALTVGHRVWCECATGWTGLRCEISLCPIGPSGRQCNGHGMCAFDAASATWSCRQAWDCSMIQGNPKYHARCSDRYTRGRLTCLEPGGFTDAHPPGRWRGLACEIDTALACGQTNDGGAHWRTCTPASSGVPSAILSELRAPRRNDGAFDAFQDACAPRDPVAGGKSVDDYACRCDDIAAGLGGAFCDVSACANPARAIGDSCTGHPGLCQNGRCECPPWNIASDKNAATTAAKRLYMNTGNDPGQPYCAEDVTACAAYVFDADGSFSRTVTSQIANSFSWSLYRCRASAYAARVGVCALDPGASATARVYACFCDATLATRCVDNRCLNCDIPAADPGGGAVVVPIPTFAGQNATAAPTAAPPSPAPTAAPTAPTGWNFAYQPRDAGAPVGAAYLLAPRVSLTAPGGPGAIYGVRSGILTDITDALFTVDPPLPSGLALDAASGNITGTPVALVPVRSVFWITVTFASGDATLRGAFPVALTVDEPCGDGLGCGDAAHGVCVREPGATGAVCACIGKWTRADADDPRSMCVNHTCVAPAVPGDLEGTHSASVCVCPSDASLSAESGCTASGCSVDPGTGEVCGASMAFDRPAGPLAVVPGKRCTVAFAGVPETPTFACACSGAYALNATTGRCDTLCDPNNTARVVVAAGAPIQCVPRDNGLRPWDPATGNRLPWCMHNGTLDATSMTRCACTAPFTGTECVVPTAVLDGSGHTVNVTRTGAQCECPSCGRHGTPNCTVARDETRCADDGSQPVCACTGLAYGASCELNPCNTALGGALAADGLSCVCGGGDPAHAYGGPYCNVTRCLNGARVIRLATGEFRCDCGADANVATQDAFCGGACVARAERRPDLGGKCTCIPPWVPRTDGTPGCTSACGVSTGTPYGSWALPYPGEACWCTPPYTTDNASCVCDPGQASSQCTLAGRCNPVYAALAGTGSAATARGAQHCLCQPPTAKHAWRGMFCSVSACGPMGAPIPVGTGATRYKFPSGCTCDPRASALTSSAAIAAALARGEVLCQPAPGAAATAACNGGTFDPVTGTCACTWDCVATANGFCDNCPSRPIGGAVNSTLPSATPAPSGPTAAPTAAPTTSAPTYAPTALPTSTAAPGAATGAPTGGTGNASSCVGVTTGTNLQGGVCQTEPQSPEDGVSGDTTSPPRNTTENAVDTGPDSGPDLTPLWSLVAVPVIIVGVVAFL